MKRLSRPASNFYEFDAFRLDAGRRLLLRDGDALNLTPRTFNMLLVLIQRRGEALSKDELSTGTGPPLSGNINAPSNSIPTTRPLISGTLNTWPRWGGARKGMFAQAIGAFQKAVSLSGGASRMLAELGHAFAVSGQKAKALEIVRQLEMKSQRQYVSPYEVALVYVGLDEREQALVWLRKAFEDRAWQLIYLRVEPKFDHLRANSRFTDLLRDVGLAPARLAPERTG